MSSQNNMAKESSSLQNVPNFYTPDDKPSNCFILKIISNFSTFTQYMSASHGYSTVGGIEYDDGDCVDKTKNEKVAH